MRTRSPSSWKGHGTQEGAGEREQVTLGEGAILFRGERGIDGGVARAKGVRQKDLTWGSRMPQDCLYTVQKGVA